MSGRPTTGAEIRAAFLAYFEERGHRRMRSASLVPGDDPTLMFTNAGMVQFKDVFTGDRAVEYTRAATSQKCLRVSGKHNDLEEVGRTPRHHTFFEMLGNFSFGDYFKEQAIEFAWEFLTGDDFCALPAERLWVSVHDSDDEAYALWRDRMGIPQERLLKLGDKDNFWSMGDTGACGPCSEIHWDRGPEYGDDPEDRLLEIWNLVFMQFDRDADGTLNPLPKPSIDTGMGLERIASVRQGFDNNYDTDLLRAVIAEGEACTGRTYGAGDDEHDLALRVIADHSRATAFLIADGILPDNEGRGYVLRRVMRRAIRFGSRIGIDDVFFHRTTLAVCDLMGEAYPELQESRAMIERAVPTEEELFRRTLDRGLGLIDKWEAGQSEGAQMPGEVAFRLHDTYGFPPDLTELIGREKGFGVDMAGFAAALQVQRETARAAHKSKMGAQADAITLPEGLTSEFVGYDSIKGQGAALLIWANGKEVERLGPGEEGDVFADRTPFYAESGGQVGDTGRLTTADAKAQVLDTQKVGALHAHRVRVDEGELRTGDALTLSVHAGQRTHTVRNHSGTHLLHFALRHVLGSHVRQRGSLVSPGRLRFDFSHFQQVTPDEVTRIETLANALVMKNTDTRVEAMAYDDAVTAGALAFFGDKYGEDVRTVRIGGDSFELCGGTHVRRSGDIGFIKVTAESSIQAGVRRIEAVTGDAALRLMQEQHATLAAAADLLHATPADTVDRIDRLLRQQRDLEKELEGLKRKLAAGGADDLVGRATVIGGAKVVAARMDHLDGKGLRDLGDRLRDKLGSSAVMLASGAGGKAALLCMVSKDLTDRIKAGDLVRAAAEQVGGRGGGRPDMAQAGGADPDGIPKALASFEAAVKGALG